jgi:catechol 2,3-dioxygenase-like lactoylglutathione lyase family enzyme
VIPEDINRRSRRVPTARSVDHVAVTVPDLEEAALFFVEVLGARLIYTEGPLSLGPWMATNLAVPEDASCRIAMMRWGPTLNIELFQYDCAGQQATPPRNSEPPPSGQRARGVPRPAKDDP